MTPCQQCRSAPATVRLTYASACATREKLLCDPCARAIRLTVPFTLVPLAPPRP